MNNIKYNKRECCANIILWRRMLAYIVNVDKVESFAAIIKVYTSTVYHYHLKINFLDFVICWDICVCVDICIYTYQIQFVHDSKNMVIYRKINEYRLFTDLHKKFCQNLLQLNFFEKFFSNFD